MSDINYQTLYLNPRMYQYIRASAITNLDDAIVELITNCVDAYTGINNNPNKITINLSKKNNYLEVIDNAIGLDAENMEKCFLEVGTYVSDETKRGHFSRGSKDISALGNCTFIAIKDNKYSECKILYDGKGAMINKNSDITEELRTKINIPQNGLYVKIDIINPQVLNDFNLDDFSYHYALRDIFQNNNFEIKFNIVDNNITKIIKYNQPNAELIIDGEFNVPEYDVKASFKLYLTENKEIKYSNNSRYTENGIIISSNNTIYENGMLHNRIISGNPHSQKIFGRIHCDYINVLLKDYENNGPTKKNPLPVIDSSRLQGLNYYHPFVKQLIKLPIERINYILSDIEYKSRTSINNENLNNLFDNDKLNKINDEIFQKLGIKLITNYNLEKIVDSIIPTNKEANIEIIEDENIINDDSKINDKISKQNEIDILPPIKQDFTNENTNLKYSRNNIDSNRQNIKELINKSAKLSLNFVDTTVDGKYEVFATNTGITINIPKTNYVIQKYVTNSAYPDTAYNDTRFKAHVADIVTEAFADLMTSADISNINISDLNQSQALQLFNSTYNKYYSIYEKQIHSIILG